VCVVGQRRSWNQVRQQERWQTARVVRFPKQRFAEAQKLRTRMEADATANAESGLTLPTNVRYWG
jgi:hypothetical protein